MHFVPRNKKRTDVIEPPYLKVRKVCNDSILENPVLNMLRLEILLAPHPPQRYQRHDIVSIYSFNKSRPRDA